MLACNNYIIATNSFLNFTQPKFNIQENNWKMIRSGTKYEERYRSLR